jgi:hypothetical protein
MKTDAAVTPGRRKTQINRDGFLVKVRCENRFVTDDLDVKTITGREGLNQLDGSRRALRGSDGRAESLKHGGRIESAFRVAQDS